MNDLSTNRRQRTLMSDAYDRIRRDILDGQLRPGARLRFEEMKAMYDIGLSPLREALTRLASEKLVLLEEHKGFRVAPISKADLLDILFMRKETESLAIRLSIQRGDDSWEAGVAAAIHELRKRNSLTPEGRIDEEWERRHRAFHYSLVAACGSPRLLSLRELLSDQAERYRRLTHRYPSNIRDHIAEHGELAEVVLERDEEGAAWLIKRHFQRTVDILLAMPDLLIEDDTDFRK